MADMAPDVFKRAELDLYWGARPEQIDRRVRQDLNHQVVPSMKDTYPVAPNFFLEVKGPDGSAAKKTMQACYAGAIGARGIHALQGYGQAEPTYDSKAYTFPRIMMAHSRCTPIILRSLRVQANRCSIIWHHWEASPLPILHKPFDKELALSETVALRTGVKKMVLDALMYVVHGLFLLVDVHEPSWVCDDLTNVMDHLSNVTWALTGGKRKKLTKLHGRQQQENV
jgi:hypothetical protein